MKEGGCVVAVLCRLCAEQQCITSRLVCLICTSCVWLPELPQHDRRMVADAGPRRPFIVNLSPCLGSAYGPKGLSKGPLDGPTC